MNLSDALEIVVARTGHERFRDVLDPDHPDYNPGFESVVMTLAGVPFALADAPQGDAAQAGAIIARLSACPFWIRVGCGCGENRCAAGAGFRGIVFPPDCAACTIGAAQNDPARNS